MRWVSISTGVIGNTLTVGNPLYSDCVRLCGSQYPESYLDLTLLHRVCNDHCYRPIVDVVNGVTFIMLLTNILPDTNIGDTSCYPTEIGTLIEKSQMFPGTETHLQRRLFLKGEYTPLFETKIVVQQSKLKVPQETQQNHLHVRVRQTRPMQFLGPVLNGSKTSYLSCNLDLDLSGFSVGSQRSGRKRFEFLKLKLELYAAY